MPRQFNHLIGNFPPTLYNALKDEGYELPEECTDIKLLMPVDGLYQLKYIVNVTDDNLAKLGRALTKIGERHKIEADTPLVFNLTDLPKINMTDISMLDKDSKCK